MRLLIAFFCLAASMAFLAVASEPAQQTQVDIPGIKVQSQLEKTTSAEQILVAAGLGTDGDALLEFFRDRIQPNADLAQELILARQLGDANDQTRAKAAARLLAHGPSAIPALRHVANELNNRQAAEQARQCLQWIEGNRATDLSIAAVQLLALRKPPTATATLLAFLPFADDEAVLAATKNALEQLNAGKADAALLDALGDKLPLRRAVAAEVLASSTQAEVLVKVRKLLDKTQPPQVRLRVSLALTQRGDEEAVGKLIDLLAELPAAERQQAEKALQQLAGEWAPTVAPAFNDELSRQARHEAWAGWWQATTGPALLAAFEKRSISKQGEILPHEDLEKLPSAAARLLAIRDPRGAAKVLLAFLPFADDQPMKDVIAASLKKLAVVDGKLDPAIVEALTDKLPVRQTAAADALVGAGAADHPAIQKLLANADPEIQMSVETALARAKERATRSTALLGLTIIAELGPKGAANPPAAKKKGAAQPALVNPAVDSDRLVGVDRNGKTLWQIDKLTTPVDFQLLSGDRVLIAEFDAKRVTERDFTGKILWQVTDLPGSPANVQRFANGNTFIAIRTAPGNPDLLIELDRTGKRVFTFESTTGTLLAGYKMADGHMIFLKNDKKNNAIHLDPTGNQVRAFTYAASKSAGAIEVTPKGHLLVVGTQTVNEYNPDGNIVWQAKAAGDYATRLANGNTLIASNTTGVVELDSAGKTVWTYQAPAGYQAVRARRVGESSPVPFRPDYGGMDPQVIAGWQKAGAQFGWITREGGDPGVSTTLVRPTDPTATPGFWFRDLSPPQGAFKAVPAPNVPFGLHFNLPKKKSGNISDAHLHELAKFGQLQALYLRSNPVTDGGLKELANLKQLQTLDLTRTQVTDAGLKHLTGLKQLQILRLGENPVTDKGLKELAGMKQLQLLNLEATQLTDAGLRHLAGFNQLENLNVRGTKVTDAGLKELTGLKQLQSLTLQNTLVTNAGLKELSKMQGLQILDVRNTNVTAAGIADLKKLLPNLKTQQGNAKAKDKKAK